MSPYELGTGSNVLGGGGSRLPIGGSTDCGRRDSGYLAVFMLAWVAGLIKPVQSPDAEVETRLWANYGIRVYANQRLSLDEEGKAYLVFGATSTSNSERTRFDASGRPCRASGYGASAATPATPKTTESRGTGRVA